MGRGAKSGQVACWWFGTIADATMWMFAGVPQERIDDVAGAADAADLADAADADA